MWSLRHYAEIMHLLYFFMNTWMNNKFNKQEFPTGNVKQIILQSALNFNQSLSLTLAPRLPSAAAESALGIGAVVGGRYRSIEHRVLGLLTLAGVTLVVPISSGLENWWVIVPQACQSSGSGMQELSQMVHRSKECPLEINDGHNTRKQDRSFCTCNPGWMP